MIDEFPLIIIERCQT